MKLALTILTLLAIVTGNTCAQVATQAAVTDNARTVASFPVRVSLSLAPDGTVYAAKGSDDLIIAVGHYVVSNGNPGYFLETDSIRFSGDDEIINMVPTGRIYEFLSREIVSEGTRLGFTPSSPDCAIPVRTKVYAASCVTRTWRGSLSTITPCAADQFSIWEYAVCTNQENNSLTVTRVPYSNMSICGGAIGMACEPSCPIDYDSMLK